MTINREDLEAGGPDFGDIADPAVERCAGALADGFGHPKPGGWDKKLVWKTRRRRRGTMRADDRVGGRLAMPTVLRFAGYRLFLQP